MSAKDLRAYIIEYKCINIVTYLCIGVDEWVVAATAEFMRTHCTFEVHTPSLGKVITKLAAWAHWKNKEEEEEEEKEERNKCKYIAILVQPSGSISV